jgi:hypothetical protein
MRKPCFLLVLFTCFCASAWPQAETARVKVHVVLVDKDLNQKPVPKLTLVFALIDEANHEPATSKTGFDGLTELQLGTGKYRLSTPEAIEFQGKKYSWDMEITVSGSEMTVELSNDNAKVTEPAPVTPVRKYRRVDYSFPKISKLRFYCMERNRQRDGVRR